MNLPLSYFESEDVVGLAEGMIGKQPVSQVGSHYGVHHLLNIATGAKGLPYAILPTIDTAHNGLANLGDFN